VILFLGSVTDLNDQVRICQRSIIFVFKNIRDAIRVYTNRKETLIKRNMSPAVLTLSVSNLKILLLSSSYM